MLTPLSGLLAAPGSPNLAPSRAPRWFAAVAVIAVLAGAMDAPLHVAALPASPPAAAGEELTLEEAIARALLHSPDVELARLDVIEARMKRDEARIDQLASRSLSDLLEAERALEAAQLRYLDALIDVALAVEEAYYRLLRAIEQAAIARLNAEQAERRFQIAAARYEAGQIPRLDYEEALLRRDEALHSHLTAESSHEDARRALRLLTGAREIQRWAPAEVPFAPLEIDLHVAIEEALAKRREVLQAARQLEAAERDLELLRVTSASPAELTRAEASLKRAEIALAQAVARVEDDVRSGYSALRRAEENVSFTERERRLAEQRLAIALMRHEAGLISLADLVSAETAWMQANLSAAGAVWDYALEKARFLRRIGRMELPPLPVEIEEFIASWKD